MKISKAEMLQYLADVFYYDYRPLRVLLKTHKVDVLTLYKLIRSPDLIDRRDEFYELFKTEETADRLWTVIWENPMIEW